MRWISRFMIYFYINKFKKEKKIKNISKYILLQSQKSTNSIVFFRLRCYAEYYWFDYNSISFPSKWVYILMCYLLVFREKKNNLFLFLIFASIAQQQSTIIIITITYIPHLIDATVKKKQQHYNNDRFPSIISISKSIFNKEKKNTDVININFNLAIDAKICTTQYHIHTYV